jgi:hypothetical protein
VTADVRQEHRGEVIVRDATALTAEQLIRINAATLAVQRLGPITIGEFSSPMVAIDVLLDASSAVARWLRDGDAEEADR